MIRFRSMSEHSQEDKNDMAEERTDLAEERTLWADQRTLLAQQRTFAGWIRTGVGVAAVGLGVAELLGEQEPKWLLQAVGFSLASLGAIIPILALLGYRKVERSMDMEKEDRLGSTITVPWLILIAMIVSLAAAGAAAIIVI